MAPPTALLLAIAFLLFATGGVRAQGFNYDFQCPDGYAITTLDYRRGANIDTTQGNIRKCTASTTSCQSYNVETQIIMKCVFYQPPGCNRACVTLTGEASQCYNALAEVRNNQTLLSLYNITNASSSWGAIGKNVIYVAGLKRTGTTNDTVQRTCCFIRNRVNEGYGGYPQGFFIADMPNNAKRVSKYIPINETWDIRTRYPNASSTALYTNIFLSNWNQPNAIWTEINDLTFNSGNQNKYAHYYSVTAAYTSSNFDLHYCDPCAAVTCMNGGTCRKPLETEYGPSFDYYKEVCTCGPNWSGAYCDCSGTVKRDVVIVFGNTNSLSNPANFNAVQLRFII
uniref:EGF-like domain-containing protein n=1 Tax=Plectus sambesii TaxID=2011161 RepID=A0A914XG51_9BILA